MYGMHHGQAIPKIADDEPQPRRVHSMYGMHHGHAIPKIVDDEPQLRRVHSMNGMHHLTATANGAFHGWNAPWSNNPKDCR